MNTKIDLSLGICLLGGLILIGTGTLSGLIIGIGVCCLSAYIGNMTKEEEPKRKKKNK